MGDLSHHFLFQVALMHFISTALKTCLENECVKKHTYFFFVSKGVKHISVTFISGFAKIVDLPFGCNKLF